MLNHIRIKNKKISTALTGINPLNPVSIDDQLDFINNWSQSIPRVMVSGVTPPLTSPGVRWVQTKENPAVKNLLGTYMFQIPGTEVCLIGSPTVKLGGDHISLLAYVDEQKLELAWACFAMGLDGVVPKVFVMSAAVVPHILRDMPTSLTFANDDWAKWLHEWSKKLLPPQRYFDATKYGLVVEPEPAPVAAPEPEQVPVMNAYEVPSLVAPSKTKKKKK